MSLQNASPRLGASSGLMGPGNSTGLNSLQPQTGRSGASPHQTSTPNAKVNAYGLKPWAVLFSRFAAKSETFPMGPLSAEIQTPRILFIGPRI